MERKADRLTLQLALQSCSLDTIADMVNKQAETLAAIPAIRPLKNMYRITSGIGHRYHPILKILRPHTGIDIAAAYGTKVIASDSGVVITSAYNSSYGNYVVISHGNGVTTLYAHLSSRSVAQDRRCPRDRR